MFRFLILTIMVLVMQSSTQGADNPPPWPLYVPYQEICHPNEPAKGKMFVVVKNSNHYTAVLGKAVKKKGEFFGKLPKKEKLKLKEKLVKKNKTSGDLVIMLPNGMVYGPLPYYAGNGVEIPIEIESIGGPGKYEVLLTRKKANGHPAFHTQCFWVEEDQDPPPPSSLKVTHPYLEYGCLIDRLTVSGNSPTYFGVEAESGAPVGGPTVKFEWIGYGVLDLVTTSSECPAAEFLPMNRFGIWQATLEGYPESVLQFEVVDDTWEQKNLAVFCWPTDPAPPEKVQFVIGDDNGWVPASGPVILLDKALQKVIAWDWTGEPFCGQVDNPGYVFSCLSDGRRTPIKPIGIGGS